MNKTVSGIGFIGSGIYHKIAISGVGHACGELSADTMSVSGIFRCPKIQKASHIDISGIFHCNSIAFAKELLVNGILNVNTVSCETFHLVGKCRVGTLQADEVTVFKDRKRKHARSQIDNVICQKLVAHDLKADIVTAMEAELYGNCEIETLFCDNVTCHGENCIIKNHIKKSS